MKIAFSVLILFVLSFPLFAQKEKAGDKLAAELFRQGYNADNFDTIFYSFSPEMQQHLSLEQTREFLSGLKQDAGKIISKEFVKYEQGFASYKTTFERAVLSVNIATNDKEKISGLLVKAFRDATLPQMARNRTSLILPFKDEWTVVWGGDTKEQNYHVESEAQKNAFDMIITDSKGASFKTNGKTNEDYYAFGKQLLAPCDGEVVLVVDGVKDNVPGVLNPVYVPGNTVIIRTAAGEYLFFAHFKQHSIVVKQGQKVKQGQLLGLCGNSGNSSEPHLHFHIQNVEEMTVATGVKCFFDKISVNGSDRTDYSPVKNDKVKNR
jgi:murein DD-endopeptidase MepM/ murein hydrolase activator NlpD